MKRREFITLVGGATAWPFAARAQQSANMRRIGLLTGLAEDNPEEQARLAGFRKGLESQGWSEGRNLRIDYRFAPGGGTDQLQTFSKELVGLRPEVILADGTPNAAALRHETRTIPIVFVNVSDPISVRALSTAWRGRVTISQDSHLLKEASPASGFQCSRRSRPAWRASPC
jgi:putative ABC transport system substrate-binding protein